MELGVILIMAGVFLDLPGLMFIGLLFVLADA